ncbi:MAG: GrpB family protein [Deltaproteobacteria bacterium]|nr:GrpB family protein [Deltaproteobacteria bacterium]
MNSIHDTVTLVPWQASWQTAFAEERQRITAAIHAAGLAAAVYHVGSTSVQGMVSKPIIDILVCPVGGAAPEQAAAALARIGYADLGECGRPGRRFLSKGDEPGKTFYVHVCDRDHPVARDQLFFQDLERGVPEVAESYMRLKQALAVCFPDDRYAYREVKGCYIRGVLDAARYAVTLPVETPFAIDLPNSGAAQETRNGRRKTLTREDIERMLRDFGQ